MGTSTAANAALDAERRKHTERMFEMVNAAIKEQSQIIKEHNEAIADLVGRLNVHLATDEQYKETVDKHDKMLRGNGEPSHDTRLSSLESRVRMLFKIGAATYSFFTAVLIGVMVYVFTH